LVTGCGGQIGTALVPKLIEKFGQDSVIQTDITHKMARNLDNDQFERLDVTDSAHYKYLMEKHEINYIVHLSGILSALGEKNPYLAMKVNGNGVINALDMAKEYNAK
jgi:threonine 3-dehydrogenase